MWWFIYAFIAGAAVVGSVLGLKLADITVGWYVWLLGALGIILLTITAQHFFASLREMEPTAAKRGALLMGLPAIILIAVAILLAV
ncbi:MAG: dehalogenase [Chloroflexi bacterium]|nr:dehalogenase [Chloroflexota bacterium]